MCIRDSLAGGHQFVGEDVLRVLQDHLGLTGSGGAHGDDILLVGGGGDGVDGSGVSVDQMCIRDSLTIVRRE